MKAAAVDYVRATNLAEAVALLARPDIDARVMAGGQSLVALMNLRLAMPDLLVDIARIPELNAVTEETGAVTFGACVTHAAIEDRRFADPSGGLMPRVAETLAYRAVRNRGTLGGSLALADPAAEWPCVLAALDAAAVVEGPQGRRSLPCRDFVTGIYETRLADGEIVAAIRVPRLSATARWGYVKLARKTGDFALALAVAVHDPERNFSRVVLGAAEGAPLVLDGVTTDRAAAPAAIAADLDRAAGRGLDEFRRGLLAVAAMRAIGQAHQ